MFVHLAWQPDVRVVDAAGAVADEKATIERGVPSRALMQRAGAAAAAEIVRRYPDALRRGATVHVGPGNNGGDGWVVARALSEAGVRVSVNVVVEPKTEDARFEAELFGRDLILATAGPPPFEQTPEGETAIASAAGVHVDALLGTGSSGQPRGAILEAIDRIELARRCGAVVVALDLPTGIDATTGRVGPAVRADLTLTFGTLKRGLLLARDHAGEIVVLDIGLAPRGHRSATPRLVTAARVRASLRAFRADAHKGDRGRLLVVGGGPGMVGAAVLAARAAYRSGIGLVRLCVAPESVPLVQGLAPEAIAAPWPETDDAARDLVSWTRALLVGPGLGRSPETRALVERMLRAGRAPVVLDADALNVFEGEAEALGALLRDRQALVTPHPLEFERLSGVEDVVERRFEVGADLATRLGAVVLLKGVPTVIHAPGGDGASRLSPLVVARGTPALAVGGSGDVLAGVCAALLAHVGNAYHSAASGAWVHGRAAELASLGPEGRRVRGVTLDDVVARLADAWPRDEGPLPYPVIAELPRVGEG